MLQAGIGVFGLIAMLFALGNHPQRRALAPFIGLAGQPFWGWYAYTAQQKGVDSSGVALITAAWTCVYAIACWRQLRRWRHA